jgi:hypothetical protein
MDGEALEVAAIVGPPEDRVPADTVSVGDAQAADRCRREGFTESVAIEAPELVEGETVDLEDRVPIGAPPAAEPSASGLQGLVVQVALEQVELFAQHVPHLEETVSFGVLQRGGHYRVEPASS